MAAAPDARATLFTDVTVELGVGVHQNVDLGPGVAFEDCDGDGDLEIYVVDGWGDNNRLFLNMGSRTFVESAVSLGVADNGYGKSVTFADYDNDGDRDMLLTRYETTQLNRFFRNEGGGVFADVSAGSGMDYGKDCTGAAWADYDNDGDLDCYITTLGNDLENRLLQNQGNGTFVDLAPALGLMDNAGWGFQPAWFDYDSDGDQDLYIANDKFGTPNRLFRNNGDGTFTNVSTESGAGISLACMGLATGDIDNDGDLDLYMTNVQHGNVLFENNGNGTFTNITVSSGTGCYVVCWGADFFDYDNDGLLDLYVAAMIPGIGPSNPVPNRLFHNEGNNVFADVSVGSGANNAGLSFSTAVGDYDNDGDLDLYVGNWYAGAGRPPSALLENNHIPRGATGSDYLRIDLVGTISNRDAVGTRVEVTVDGVTQMRYRQIGTSYLSSSEATLHFGVGEATMIDEVRILWPSGIVETYTDVPAGQRITFVEGGVTGAPVQVTGGGALLSIAPNPFVEGTTLRFAEQLPEGARLSVIGPQGRRVVELPASGSEQVHWDGRDARGRRVAPGVYFVRVYVRSEVPLLARMVRMP